MIIEAQKKDEELQQKVQLVKANDKTDFSVREDGSLYFQNRLCVPADNELKKELLHEAHNSVFTMHPWGLQDVPGFEMVLLVERNEKRCDRVCIKVFDVLASKSSTPSAIKFVESHSNSTMEMG